MEDKNTNGLIEPALPLALVEALRFIFAAPLQATMLVGGSALSGFFAQHRRSDDLDLFVADLEEHSLVSHQIKEIQSIGAVFESEKRGRGYLRVLCVLSDYHFTIDVVHDSNLFKIGSSIVHAYDIRTADLKTIAMMKCATLVSRCSEKDLYDMLWLHENLMPMSPEMILEWGRKIDGGVNVESLIYSLGSAELKKDSCGFCLIPGGEKAVFSSITHYREKLLKEFLEYAETQPVEATLADMVRRTKKFLQRKRNSS